MTTRTGKTVGTFACILAAAVAQSVAADVITSENFQSYASGTQLDANGWTERDADRTWTISAPSGTGNASSQVVTYGGSSGASVYKAFTNPAAIPAGTTDYYISFYARPNGTSATMALWNLTAGANAPNDSYVGPFFGVNGTGFNIRGAGFGTTYTSTALTAVSADWYEIRLQITVTPTLSNSVGTLYIRDITAGETTLHAISDLTNINLGLTSSPRDPSLYTGWRMRCGGGAEFDNLEFGTGTLAVPEPAAIGALLPAGALLLLNRKR